MSKILSFFKLISKVYIGADILFSSKNREGVKFKRIVENNYNKNLKRITIT